MIQKQAPLLPHPNPPSPASLPLQVVVGHHPLFGPTSANGYNASAFNVEDTGMFDLGRPDAKGQHSFESVSGRTSPPSAICPWAPAVIPHFPPLGA